MVSLLSLAWDDLVVQFVPLTQQAEDRRPVGLQPTVYVSMVLLLSNTAVRHTGEKTSLSEPSGVDIG